MGSMKPNLAFAVLLVGWSLFEGGATAGAGEAKVKVDLKQGSIETSRIDVEDGRSYYAFKNIPFAEPPTGSLRFKDPVPAGRWSGVRNGSEDISPCPQIDLMTYFNEEQSIMGNEDCLYLNVYTPDPDSSDLPVMVWIHGGGFILGSASEYEPTHLMTKDVVVVVIQYRIGTLGFLSTEDSVMPGNYGLKDQVMALRWVQENIQSFGGDPKKVTIFGESAGGMSVHYLMMFPTSKGLFQRAIAQSGFATFPGMVRTDHRQRAAEMGQMLECEVDPSAFDSQALYDCLQDATPDKLVMLANAFAKFNGAPSVMTARVDGEFLPEHPMKMIQEGKYHKVDFMAGVTRDEGSFIVRPLVPNKAVVDSLAQNFSVNGPFMVGLEDDESGAYIAKRLFYHYLGDIHVNEETADGACKMYTELYFHIPLDLAGKMHARDAAFGSKTFLYEVHHLGEFQFLATPNDTFGKHWVGHGDDLQYLFSSPMAGSITKPVDKFMSEVMVSLWTNFAVTGNPTPDMSLGFKWDPLSGSDLQYLILQPSPYMRNFTRHEEMEFIMNLPTNFNKRFFPERFVNDLK